jgi:hypothetical protein
VVCPQKLTNKSHPHLTQLIRESFIQCLLILLN